MAFTAFIATTCASSLKGSSSSPRAQPSRRTLLNDRPAPRLTCAGCGAPLQWAGAACTYCRPAVRREAAYVGPAAPGTRLQAVGDRVLAVSPEAPPAWVTPGGLAPVEFQLDTLTLAAVSQQPYTIGVDPGAPAGDQTSVVICTPSDSGAGLTLDSFDAGTGSDW